MYMLYVLYEMFSVDFSFLASTWLLNTISMPCATEQDCEVFVCACNSLRGVRLLGSKMTTVGSLDV